MINLGLEVDLWRLEGVIRWKMDHDKEDPSSIRAFSWTHYSCLPMEEVLTHRPCTAGGGGIPLQVLKLLLNTLAGHASLGMKKAQYPLRWGIRRASQVLI